jgi:hypothetical protein
MPRISVFADESGNFDFARKKGASRYFILTTIACPSFQVGDALLRLRREIAWEGHGTDSEFHATTDAQAVRDRVFDVLRAHDFRVDATIMEKARANPQTRTGEERFYKLAWYLHMKHVAPRVVRRARRAFRGGRLAGRKEEAGGDARRGKGRGAAGEPHHQLSHGVVERAQRALPAGGGLLLLGAEP